MRAIFPTCLAMCAAALVPAGASASVPFDVSASGTVKESWSTDRDPVSDGCGRRSTGDGEATLRFATAKPYRLTLDNYTGFHSKPPVTVTVERRGNVTTTGGDASCTDPAPAASGCGTRSFAARLDLGMSTPWTKKLTAGDASAYPDCPVPGDFGAPKGLGFDGRFETIDLLQAYGPKLRITRRLFGGCDAQRHCTHARKRTVIHFRKHVELPFTQAGEEFGRYSADVDWTVTTVARFKLPPRR